MEEFETCVYFTPGTLTPGDGVKKEQIDVTLGKDFAITHRMAGVTLLIG